MSVEILNSKFPNVVGPQAFIKQSSKLHSFLCPHFWVWCWWLTGTDFR